MSLLVVVLTLVLLAAVIGVIARPLFTSHAPDHAGSMSSSEDHAHVKADGWETKRRESNAARSELEAAREAKYREIRDAELDYRTGKLSNEDYQAINGTLRAEAVEILDRLEALTEQEGGPGAAK
jgi:hypothetical protein